jgi:peroxiredoxin
MLCILTALGVGPVFADKILSAGDELPDFALRIPASEEIREYLGLKDAKTFSVTQLPAKLVLIEVFGVYCPVCAKQAPSMNKLYKFIQDNSDLTNDIKMIGVASGNKYKEIDVYKTKFKVPFPVFEDPYLNVHKKLGSPGIPFVIVTTNTGKVLQTHGGYIDNIEEFFAQIKKHHEKL